METDFFKPKPDYMNIEHYTPVRLPKKHLQVSHIFKVHIEPFLLSLLVLAGIIGSIYLFGQKIIISNSTATVPESNGSPMVSSMAALAISEEEAPANSFDKFVKMESKIAAGQAIGIRFLQDEKATRYVMEMGDGVRLIVTQKELFYVYEQPGKYVIELKEIKDGLLHIIGTKKIKVK
ncbi:MAG: hypothetical protein LC107_00180 [Chitinophagales bacterium]|nr:hypothetical protein [Chitinophagales bacterium]